MKSPREYLEAARLEWPEGCVPVVPITDALRAIELALADAETYKTHLIGALRRSPAPTLQADAATPEND